VFGLNESQKRKLSDWERELEAKIKAKEGYSPYYGATGGQLTFMFTPTNLGVVVKVEHCYTKETIDLSEYENW
jgi:hypothetical protein